MKIRLKVLLFFAVVLMVGAAGMSARAGVLTCAVRTSSCNAGEVVVFKMSGTTNAHAELSSQNHYTNLVCCGGTSDMSNTCTNTFATVLKLQNTTNSHVQQNSQSGYANSACLSVSQGSVTVAYQPTDCTGYDAIVASMSAATNGHVGNSAAYSTKICATVTPVVSVTVSNGVVSYGTLAANTSQDTTASGLNNTQIATNGGNIAEDFNIKGQNTACPWTLAATSGSNQYIHKFSINSGSSYTALTTNYQALATAVVASGTQSFDLRITTPTSSSCFTQQSTDVVIQAVQH